MSKTLVGKARDSHGTSHLSVSQYPMRKSGILSPFFQLKHCPDTRGLLRRRLQSTQTGRDITISELMKAIIVNYYVSGTAQMAAMYRVFDSSNVMIYEGSVVANNIYNATSPSDYTGWFNTLIIADFLEQMSMNITEEDIIPLFGNALV